MTRFTSFVPVTAALVLMVAPALRAESASDRLQEAATVLEEVMQAGDKGIPTDLLERAHCVVIVPGVKKLALGVGGKYGRGFSVCRTADHKAWGAPAAVRMEGGSIGWQIGGSESDVILLVMTETGARRLLDSKFTLDANAGVAAGPVGRTAQASTDAKLTAGILSYSRSRGLFAGLSVGGATLRNDLDENKELYGKEMTNKQIVAQNVAPPETAGRLISALTKYSRTEAGGAERTRKP
ncbi:MAG TPA: lipid-binding SYLF domain-containing protein [Bryobacteraceae bacterium]|nr:lipid-binding SYLF domain-containing protein [Bryobacteraceae bacterium]